MYEINLKYLKNTLCIIVLILLQTSGLLLNVSAQFRTLVSGEIVRNPDQVYASAYDGIPETLPNVGLWRDLFIINTAHRSRIRQSGIITKIEFYMHSKPLSLRTLNFEIWRRNGANFDRVGQQNILDLTTGSQINSIVLPITMPALEGDYIGFSYTSFGIVPGFFLTKIDIANGGYYSFTPPASTNYDWGSKQPLNGYIPIRVYMQAPQIVHTGDSYPSGYPVHNSYINLDIADGLTTTFPYKVQTALGWAGQNMGGNAHTTYLIAVRFTQDVVNLKPKYAVIDGGGNDIFQDKTQQEFIGNWTGMLNDCTANDIIPVVMLIPPFTNFTNAQSQAIDTWNSALVNLLTNYPTSILIDVRPIIGQYRPGGDSANLWDIKPEYNVDGVHLNEAGYTLVADLIVSAINASLNPPANNMPGQNIESRSSVAESGNALPSLHPNPVTDVLTIRLEATHNIDVIQVLTLGGQLLKEQKITGRISNINMADLSSSLYLVRVMNEKTVTIFKVFKK